MSTLRQIDDLRDISELECQLDNALDVVARIEKTMQSARDAISSGNPFNLMTALSEANKLIMWDAMPITIIAQAEYLKPIKQDAQRIA